MKFTNLLARFILVLAFTAGAHAGSLSDDIAALAEHGFLNNPEYWTENATPDGKCDGAKTASLLIKLAGVFKKVSSIEDALAVLEEHRVIGSPDYWKKSAVSGGTCVGKNVSVVINRCAARIPVPPPKSAKATPLEPMPADKLRDSYDIIVAGAGTGGIGAAAQAVRMGRSVLLLEETDWIGGQAMAAAVTSMDEGGTLVRERGIYRELCGLIFSHYQPLGINPMTAYDFGHTCVEPRVGRRVLLMLLNDARGSGILDLALRSRVIKVSRSGDTVTGVDIESATSSGKQTCHIASKVLIDATEWGDVIPLTGARYRVGNCTSDAIDPARHVQDNTWTAVIKQYPNGVPDELLIKEPPPGYTDKVHAAFVRSLVNGDDKGHNERPWSWKRFIGYRGMPDSSRAGDAPPITRTHMNFNNDFLSTVAEIEDSTRRTETNRAMRLKTLHLLYYVQHTLGKTDWSVANDEGFDSAYNRGEIDAWIAERPDLKLYRAILYHFSPIPYVRESRRIIGKHTLTAHEIERKNSKPIPFAHAVALGDYPVDMHGSMSKPYLELDLDHESDIPDKFGGKGIGPFAIPFECFIPEKLDGFLPAEKNLSQSRMANGATRLQPHTMNMGQAVGVIAALAVEQRIPPRAVDPVAVQKILLEAGDTLAIEPVKDARWGTKEWREKQMEVLRAGQKTK